MASDGIIARGGERLQACGAARDDPLPVLLQHERANQAEDSAVVRDPKGREASMPITLWAA